MNAVLFYLFFTGISIFLCRAHNYLWAAYGISVHCAWLIAFRTLSFMHKTQVIRSTSHSGSTRLEIRTCQSKSVVHILHPTQDLQLDGVWYNCPKRSAGVFPFCRSQDLQVAEAIVDLY